jgi:hydroxypyruvate isomerase
MPRFSANITFLFREFPLTQRFHAARKAGFSAVEILSDENTPVDELALACRSSAMQVALINVPMGDFTAGGPGLSAVPGRQSEFREAVCRSIAMADALACDRIHIGASLVPAEASWQDCYRTYVRNVGFAIEKMADSDITLTLEPLNNLDSPAVFLHRVEQALRVIDELDMPRLMLQFDVYHMARMEEDYLSLLEDNIERIGHIQIADVPGRGEPGSGTLDFPRLFKRLDQLGYDGWVGAEYLPSRATEETLGWFRPFAGLPAGQLMG